MTDFIQPVILCGGSGTRLWPLSRAGFPKQFLCLTGAHSLFQQAAQRLMGLGSSDIHVGKPLIVTGEEHRFLAAEQLREVGIELGAALLEPVGRNTAPALTLAALAAQADGLDPVMVVTPADQTVANTAAFTQAMQRAVNEAFGGAIVILGITPDTPETGYGYIQTTEGKHELAMMVRRFVEKPNASTAQQYLAEGDYYWNAGMFVLKAYSLMKGGVDDIGLDHQVLVDEFGWVGVVGVNATYLGRGQINLLWLFRREKIAHSSLAGEIQLRVIASDDSVCWMTAPK